MKQKKYNSEHRLSQEQYDPIEIKFLAGQYLQTANRCGDEKDILNWLPVPETVNRSFACELYMKAILLYNGNYPHDHNLTELFGKLPQEIQKKLKSEVQQDTGYGEVEFNAKLQAISDIFEECRYVHEYSELTIDLLFLRVFSMKLAQILSE